MFENVFNAFENRRLSTRRIAYYVPTSQTVNQTKAQKLNFYQNTNNGTNRSEIEDYDDLILNNIQLQQTSCTTETNPSNIYQSFLKRNFNRNKKTHKNSPFDRSDLNEQNSLLNQSDGNQINQINSQLNNFNNNDININQNDQNEEQDNSPLVLTLLGNNPIIFTRRRAINSSNAANADKKLSYCDEMPESKKFILITSNIFGTRFKFLSLTNWLPSSLGSISYKTSLLHLQPRQMRIQIKELLFNSHNAPFSNNSGDQVIGNQHSLQSRITENILKSCESDYNFNVDEDYEWNNTSFEEDDEYLKTIPVAPLSPQFQDSQKHPLSSNKLPNQAIDFCSMEDYLTFQIDPSSEQINCNLTFSSPNQPNYHLNYLSLNEFCQQHGQHFKEDSHYLRSLNQPTQTITNSVSTQTSFPSLNNLENDEDCETIENNTMQTLASCSRLIHSSSMICPGKSANQYKNEIIDRNGEFTKRLINRNSLDLSLQRRLTLKKRRRPLSSYSLKLDNRAKCVLNCMYLDNEDDLLVEENKACYQNGGCEIDDERNHRFDDILDLNKDKKDEDSDNYQMVYEQIFNRIHSSNESLLESYCFDDQINQSTTSNKLMKEDSDLSSKLNFNHINRNIFNKQNAMPPSTPVHKRKQFNDVNNLADRMKDLNNNNSRKKLLNSNQFYSNDSINESDVDEIRILSRTNTGTKMSNSTSDLLIEQNELNEERRKSELRDRISIRSDNYEFNSNDLNSRQRSIFINRSLPTTPTLEAKKARKRSFGKTLLYSPIMIRKAMKQK